MKKRILLTGASGFIGSHLLKKLLRLNYPVTVLARNPAKFKKHPLLTIIRADLTNLQKTKIPSADVVIHLAAALNSFEKNATLHKTNITGLQALLKKTSGSKFIFASSIDAGIRNTDYARSKLAGENLVKKISARYIIARIGHVYGENRDSFTASIREIASKNKLKSSLLYYHLKNKHLYPIKLENLIKKLTFLINDNSSLNQTIKLIDKKTSVKQALKGLRKPKKTFLGSLILKLYTLLGKILKRADLLIYLNLEK